MREQKIPFKTEVSFKLNFNDEPLGSFRADLVIDDKILVELKVVDRLTNDHRLQLLRYLEALNLELALLVNFRLRPLQIIRVIRGARAH